MSADPAAMQQLELVCFTLIVDDIVFPDGRTRMGVLGGGGKLLCQRSIGPCSALHSRRHTGLQSSQ